MFSYQFAPEVVTEYNACLTGGAQCELVQSTTDPGTCFYGPYELTEGCEPAVEVITDPPPNPDSNPLPFNPQPQPNPQPLPIPQPIPPTQPVPNLPQSGISNPAECAPAGWELLNPLAYVTGMGCVLTWAFVPPSPQTAVDRISIAFNNTALGVITTAMYQLVAPFVAFEGADASTNCQGPNIVIPFALGEDFSIYPFSACESPAKEASEIVRTISTITFYISGIFIVTSIVLSAFGISLGGYFSRGDD